MRELRPHESQREMSGKDEAREQRERERERITQLGLGLGLGLGLDKRLPRRVHLVH